MSRISNADALAQAQAARHSMCHLCVIEFDDATVRLCDSFKTIIWDGETYPACGDFAGFDSITESSDLEIQTISAGLSGVDQTYLSDLFDRNYLDRPIKIYRAYLDDAGDIIGEPVTIFDGRMDQPSIKDNPADGSFMVSIAASSTWKDFDKTNGLQTNDNTHQRIFSGDKGFEFAAQILDSITWGRAT